MKACCVNGVTEIPPEKLKIFRQELRREIMSAIKDGYTTFLCGFEDGVDLEFAAIIIKIKETRPDIFLEAALAYPGKLKGRSERFQQLLKHVNGIMPVSRNDDANSDIALRMYLINMSQREIAVFDGNCESHIDLAIRASEADKREIRIIKV